MLFIAKGAALWRAQLGSNEPGWVMDESKQWLLNEYYSPFSAERMKPRFDSAAEGRANPKGIPCLYLAEDVKTAMSEVRPWIGASITLGRFEITRNINIIDLTLRTPVTLRDASKGKNIKLQELESKNWEEIDAAFARPVSPTDSKADYVPTQIIAELFKVNGYDGIRYASSLGRGHNLALFDLYYADVVGLFVYNTNNLDFQFEPHPLEVNVSGKRYPSV